MAATEQHYSIGAVERDTGIARDTLRVWERRYGCPVPSRNDRGERVYSESQIRQLQRIQRLMGQGHRPGKLLRMQEAELSLIEDELGQDIEAALADDVRSLIEATRGLDTVRLDDELQRLYRQQGMADLILKTVVPLLRAVGELWAAGKLQIFQEHLLSERLLRFFGAEIAAQQQYCKKPLVLLATLPGEQHTLGLMMVAGMLTSHRVATLNIGGQVPIDQIAAAADQFNVDAVGITFSSAYHYPSIRPDLQELRDALGEGVDVWAGGEGVRRLRKLPDDVYKFTTLETLPI